MSDEQGARLRSDTARFYAIVKSLREFDDAKVYPIVTTLISVAGDDAFVQGLYWRIRGNTNSALALSDSIHFQATAGIARSLFELSLDISLIDKKVVPNAEKAILLFEDAEKLRVARRSVGFKQRNPGASINITEYQRFITKNAARIDAEHLALWGPCKNKKPKTLTHWSNLDLPSRISKVGDPFREWHLEFYSQFSWYSHTGFTGFRNLAAETFIAVQALAFVLSALCYKESLMCLIRRFQIDKADEEALEHLEIAHVLPFATEQQARNLR
ncbi:MAG TPA: hypothetical protein VGK99_03945 [Acidobacteriota bacterium]